MKMTECALFASPKSLMAGVSRLWFFALAILLCACGGPRGNQRSGTEGEAGAGEGRASNLPGTIDSLSYRPVEIDSVSFSGLRVYYPTGPYVKLVVGEVPDTSNCNISFCCAASYTGASIYLHKAVRHSDVAGDHIESGEPAKGYECPNNTGGFVFWGGDSGEWAFLNKGEYDACLGRDVKPWTAFQQELLIYKGEIRPFVREDRVDFYRAFCNLNGRLCFVDGVRHHLLSSFVDLLRNAGVSDALYMDMGGWKYSWYRDYKGQEYNHGLGRAVIIYSKPSIRPYLGSNWLVFDYVKN